MLAQKGFMDWLWLLSRGDKKPKILAYAKTETTDTLGIQGVQMNQFFFSTVLIRVEVPGARVQLAKLR